jgi:hypothetical protein
MYSPARLPAATWLVLGIVLVADIMDLLDSTITITITITTIAAPTISSSFLFGARRGATIGRPPGSTPLGRLALAVVLRGMRP